jgi:D-aminopeptidase
MNILIIADIEGSSGITSSIGAKWLNSEWAMACRELTLDIKAVVDELINKVDKITIVDFHRTGFNLISDMLPRQLTLRQGYKIGPVPGIGEAPAADRVFFIGMHAASCSNGFLPHTLTSRFLELNVNGKILTELELFAGSLGKYGISPAFFSGGPIACRQAEERIPGILCCKVARRPMSAVSRQSFRQELAHKAVSACFSKAPPPFYPGGPFKVSYKLLRKNEKPENCKTESFIAANFDQMYWQLLHLAYFNSLRTGFLPLALRIHNAFGRLGLQLAQKIW